MRAIRLAAAALLLASLAYGPHASAQPPPPATAQALQDGLFGEPEPAPGDYDQRRRESFAAAEALQGPLDGGWTLTAENAGAILDLRFVDRKDRLEAVWRDRRRTGPTASGTVDKITRLGTRLTLEFAVAPGAEDFLSLSRTPRGWSGELTEKGGTRPVWLVRTSP
jgi:hypothetical protein